MKSLIFLFALSISAFANPLIILSGGGSGVDTTAPALTLATINGTAVSLQFSEIVSQGAGYNDSDFDLDLSIAGNNVALAYVSGNGTNTHLYTAASAAVSGETVDIDFNGDANSIEDAAGNDLAAIVSGAVSNITPAYHGNLNTPYGSSSFISPNLGTPFAIAYKVDLGATLSGSVVDIRAMVSGLGTNTREQTWSIFSHDGTNNRPDTCIATTGRFFNAAVTTTPTDLLTVATNGSVSGLSTIWIVVFSEITGDGTNGRPRYYYQTATGGTTLEVVLAANEWLDRSLVGQAWTGLANHGTATTHAYQMQFRVKF